MLYATTRNKHDVHTAHKTLTVDKIDSGLFVPMQLPTLTKEDITALGEKTFGQNVAEILNLFFAGRLDGWDVDFSIGRYPCKLVPMNRKIVVAEAWHNPDSDFARIVRNLAGRLRGNDNEAGVPSNWAWIAIRIAVLFGLFGEMFRHGIASADNKIDIALPAGDFSGPMAVWYAREMGLPVGNVICSCNENSALWELLHHGAMRTDIVAQSTSTPECDVGVPFGIERLISSVLGTQEAERFRSVCSQGMVYAPGEDKIDALRKGIYIAVVGQMRMESVIYNVYRTSTYLLDPYSALAYGGLQDYHSAAGEGRMTLLLSERSPICSAATVAKAMGINVKDLKDRLGIM